MLGAIIGDVVGSRFEFHNIKSKKFLMFHPFCHVTDDTVMTIAIAKSLCEYFSGVGNLECLCIKNMQQFGRKICTSYGSMFYKWIWSDNPKPYNSYGDGAVMRVSPVAYFAKDLDECKELAKRVTAVTHNHPQALKAAECVACCVFLSIHGTSKEDIKNFVTENYYKLDFTIDEIRDSYSYRGDCDGTVPYAIECFLEGNSFEDVIRNAISLGSDSDTLAAIAGSIAEFAMPHKYYRIARHYCRKNWFLRKQFKYIEYARATVMEYYNSNSPEFSSMQFPFMKKKNIQNWKSSILKEYEKEPKSQSEGKKQNIKKLKKLCLVTLAVILMNIPFQLKTIISMEIACLFFALGILFLTDIEDGLSKSFPKIGLSFLFFLLVTRFASSRYILSNIDSFSTNAISELSLKTSIINSTLKMLGYAIFVFVSYHIIILFNSRIAEVSSRCMMDSMNGIFSEIENEFKKGRIDEKEVSFRKNKVVERISFYSDMIGLSKFTKGIGKAFAFISFATFTGCIALSFYHKIFNPLLLQKITKIIIFDGVTSLGILILSAMGFTIKILKFHYSDWYIECRFNFR